MKLQIISQEMLEEAPSPHKQDNLNLSRTPRPWRVLEEQLTWGPWVPLPLSLLPQGCPFPL